MLNLASGFFSFPWFLGFSKIVLGQFWSSARGEKRAGRGREGGNMDVGSHRRSLI
jgi:hypothetical protein